MLSSAKDVMSDVSLRTMCNWLHHGNLVLYGKSTRQIYCGNYSSNMATATPTINSSLLCSLLEIKLHLY